MIDLNVRIFADHSKLPEFKVKVAKLPTYKKNAFEPINGLICTVQIYIQKGNNFTAVCTTQKSWAASVKMLVKENPNYGAKPINLKTGQSEPPTPETEPS